MNDREHSKIMQAVYEALRDYEQGYITPSVSRVGLLSAEGTAVYDKVEKAIKGAEVPSRVGC